MRSHPSLRRRVLVALVVVLALLAVWWVSRAPDRPAEVASTSGPHVSPGASPQAPSVPAPQASAGALAALDPAHARAGGAASPASDGGAARGEAPRDEVRKDGRVVAGVVVDLRGAPVAGAVLTLTQLDDGATRVATSGASGTFVFRGASPAELRVAAEADGGGLDAAWVEPGLDEEFVKLVVEPTATIQVAGPAGAFATVSVRCIDDRCFGGNAPWQDSGVMSDELLAAITAPPSDEAAPPVAAEPAEAPAPEGAEAGEEGDGARLDLANLAPSWSVAGEDELGVPIEVAADLTYEIVVDGPAFGGQRSCGCVRPSPGERLVVPCGVPGKARLTGRAVGVDGRPLAGLPMELDLFDQRSEQRWRAEAVTDEDGAFELVAEVDAARTGNVNPLERDKWLGGRGLVDVVAGRTLALGDVLVAPMPTAQEQEALAQRYAEDPLGALGAMLAEGFYGCTLLRVAPGGVFNRSGLGEGDVIVRIGDRSANHINFLERDRLLVPGVALRVRGADGELFETRLVR